jgi:ATP-dependent protease ClpP protease subunit
MTTLFGEITPEKAEGVIQNIYSGERSLLISSESGDLYAALAIHDALREHEGTTIGTGLVASSAVFVLLGGAHRYATPNCRFMTHPITTAGEPDATEIEEAAYMQHQLSHILTECTSMPWRMAAGLLAEKNIFGLAYAMTVGLVQGVPQTCGDL